MPRTVEYLHELFDMPEAFSSVPKIAYSRLQDPNTKDAELLRLREAIFVVGFLYLTDTGLEVRQVIDAVEVSRKRIDQDIGSYSPSPRSTARAFFTTFGG